MSRHASFGVVLLILAAAPLGADRALAQDATTNLPSGSRVMIQTADGRLTDARWTAADGDSILLLKGGDRRIAIPIGDVRGVWTWRRDAFGGLKAGAFYGALSGLAAGFAVPGDCIDCDEERGSSSYVLGSTLVNAATFGLIGLLVGHWSGAWNVHSGFNGSPTTPTGGPFPLWSMAASIGGTFNVDRSETHPSIVIAGYRNSSPGSSLGFEFGTLELPERRPYNFTYAVDDMPWDTLSTASRTITAEGEVETALMYATFFVARMRGTSGSLRSQFLIGPAAYGRWTASSRTETVRDSSGAVTSTSISSGGSVNSSLGLMVGMGTSFGQGTFRPALRARGHWILTGSENVALTLEAGLDFQ